jgi:hypothetical protein
MTSKTITFSQLSVDPLLDRLRLITGKVDAISDVQFINLPDREIASFVCAEYIEHPIQLEQLTRHDIPSEERRYHPAESQQCPLDINGQPYEVWRRLTVSAQMMGSDWLLGRWGIARFDNDLVEVIIHRETRNKLAELTIEISARYSVTIEDINTELNRHIDAISSAIQLTNQKIIEFNDRIPLAVSKAITARRRRLLEHSRLINLINIPIRFNDDAPPLTPINIEVVRLPICRATSQILPEPGILPETYDKILDVIRHLSATYESTPKTFLRLDEEDIRNLILASLNMYFKGGASGEVFRRGGKTDILIMDENRAAFVGECKIWNGSADAIKAVDQLFNYLTWRDSKAALIVFNKSVKFSTVLGSLPSAVRSHATFVRELTAQPIGEWRMEMRSPNDDERLVTLHLIAIDLIA